MQKPKINLFLIFTRFCTIMLNFPKEVGVVVFRANAIKKYLPVLVVGQRGVGRLGCRGSGGGRGGRGDLFVP
jgi:hypothetical protein